MARLCSLRTTAYLGGAWLVCLAGCSSAPPSGRAGGRSADAGAYQTLAPSPRQDTTVAARENQRGLDLLAKDDLGGAEAAFRAALGADVMHGPAHNSLGMVYYRRRQLYWAAWEFQYAIKLMPNQPEPRNNLGLVFETGGKFEQAAELYKAAMKMEPDNAQFVGNLAKARLRAGEGDEEVRGLLMKVVSIDSRPEWVEWARERLVLMKRPTTGSSN